MRVLSIVFVLGLSLSAFAKNDCSKKDNFLQYLHDDFYHKVELTANGKVRLNNEAGNVRLKSNQVLKVIDIDIIDDQYYEIYVEDQKERPLPVIRFYPKKGQDPYKATVADFEKKGLFKVNCDMINYRQHASAEGKAYFTKLRK